MFQVQGCLCLGLESKYSSLNSQFCACNNTKDLRYKLALGMMHFLQTYLLSSFLFSVVTAINTPSPSQSAIRTIYEFPNETWVETLPSAPMANSSLTSSAHRKYTHSTPAIPPLAPQNFSTTFPSQLVSQELLKSNLTSSPLSQETGPSKRSAQHLAPGLSGKSTLFTARRIYPLYPRFQIYRKQIF